MSGSQQRPVSLAQARDAADRLWPGRDAKPAAWLVFHRERAELFTRAAQSDPGHRHEAAFLASVEREEADAVAARITPAGKDGMSQHLSGCGEVNAGER